MNIQKRFSQDNTGNKKQPELALWLKVGCFLLILAAALGYYVLTPLPAPGGHRADWPRSFAIVSENYFEDQPPGQCSAYSAAFILRHMGYKSEGAAVYKQLNFKLPVSGYVLPKGVLQFMNSQGVSSRIFRGEETGSLKSALYAGGNPVMLIIGDGVRWQHYITLVGYDESLEDLYFYDSKKTADENGGLPGNRTISEDYFLELWDNGLPIFNQVYFIFEPKDTDRQS